MRWFVFSIALLTLAGCGKEQKSAPTKAKKPAVKNERDRLMQEKQAVNTFAAALRPAFASPRAELANKFKSIPTDGLPEDLREAWEAMLAAWEKLPTGPASPEIVKSGQATANSLNNRLRAHGVLDLRF
jgi:hypothetical protein